MSEVVGAERISAAFATAKSEGRGVLVAYLMGGDPDIASTPAFLHALEAGGADLIEVGIPFSDPVADGPTIQAASVRAMNAGVRPRDVLAAIRKYRDQGGAVPVVTMTYGNIPYVMGYDAYASALKASGVDGTIIPDIPVEEAGPLSDALASEGLANILLAAPLTIGDRLKKVASATRGFLYLVGSFGTTGARSELAPETVAVLEAATPAAHAAEIPLAVGFGVSTPEQVRTLVAHGADGVVVGSALVARVASGATPAELEAAVRILASGLR